MLSKLSDFRSVFFIGIAGTGMSAVAQYLNGIGKKVCGSDRYFVDGTENATRVLLEKEGIRCFEQNGEGITDGLELVVISTAVEENVPEMVKARSLGIPVMKRSELLALIVESKPAIAVAGTSGKSTTAAMIFTILEYAGMSPSIISGAGLVSIMDAGKIGNAKVGEGQWLIIEADESDGSIIQYHPQIGVLLNIDKDHKEIDELIRLFGVFRSHCNHFVTNQGHSLAASLSKDLSCDFSTSSGNGLRYEATGLTQSGMDVAFEVQNVPFQLHLPGKHNVENALAAIAVSGLLGVDLKIASAALLTYKGIYRRHQLLGRHKGIWLIDDYAHNPAKCAASVSACQALASKVIAWFQPHGYGPTRFLRNEFVESLAAVMREEDEIWMSEIFYAGGAATRDISAADLIKDLGSKGVHAYFLPGRDALVDALKGHFTNDCVLLLMGARDPSLESFAHEVWRQVQEI